MKMLIIEKNKKEAEGEHGTDPPSELPELNQPC
jgi:hypothetical protein